MAAGYAAGVSIEVRDAKMTNRSRKIKFFLDKMKAKENQTDSVAKLVKDLTTKVLQKKYLGIESVSYTHLLRRSWTKGKNLLPCDDYMRKFWNS